MLTGISATLFNEHPSFLYQSVYDISE